jgi:hypothetical protein
MESHPIQVQKQFSGIMIVFATNGGGIAYLKE